MRGKPAPQTLSAIETFMLQDRHLRMASGVSACCLPKRFASSGSNDRPDIQGVPALAAPACCLTAGPIRSLITRTRRCGPKFC